MTATRRVRTAEERKKHDAEVRARFEAAFKTQEEIDQANLRLTRAGCDAVWRPLNVGGRCHPFRWLGSPVEARPELTKADLPRDYDHWLRIVDDVTAGRTIDVFYPHKPKEGQRITVIVDGADVEWTHGEPGLFYQHVYPLLGAARLPKARQWGYYTGRLTMLEVEEHFALCADQQNATDEAVRVAGILGSTGKRLREVSNLPIADVEAAARATLGQSLRELRTRYAAAVYRLYCSPTTAQSVYLCDVLRVGYDPVGWSTYLGEYVYPASDEDELARVCELVPLPKYLLGARKFSPPIYDPDVIAA